MRRDKKLHLIVGLGVGALTMFLTSGNAYYTSLAILLAGVIKEVYDYFNRDKHTVDIYDALYTFLGGAIGTIAVKLLIFV
jgi:hypothetical protein